MTASGFILLIVSLAVGRLMTWLVKSLPATAAVNHRPLCRSAGVESAHVITGATFAIAAWSLAVTPPGTAWVTASLGWCLLLLSLLDLRQFWLPDALTLPLLVAGLAHASIANEGALLAHAIGAAAGWGLLILVGVVFSAARGVEGLGQGDAKLFGAAGAWVGYTGLPGVLLIGAVAALAVAVTARRRALPFGPFIATGFWLTWLYGPIAF